MSQAGDQSASGRFAPRYRKSSLVWYHLLDAGVGEVVEGIGTGYDMSRSGFGITAAHALPLGARVFVHLRGRELELSAVVRVSRVRWVSDTQYEIGLQILLVPPDQRALLARLFP